MKVGRDTLLNIGADKMKNIIIIFLLALVFAVGGCPSSDFLFQEKSKVGIPKNFFGRTITYTVAPEAKESLSKLETLLAQSEEMKEPLPDRVLLPLYRDTDVNRDHHITAAEAEAYYREYILKFEDSLDSVSY
jgi:hypothetical protein